MTMAIAEGTGTTPLQKHPRYRVSVPVALITPTGDVEERDLEDISLGGVFVRTPVPPPEGSFVRLRLRVADGPLALMGRVVHVIDAASGAQKARQPGMGVQFDGLSPEVEQKLALFVNALVEEQRRRRADDCLARFTSANRVVVPADRKALARVWHDGLGRGTLKAMGSARIGNRVDVVVGPLKLHADVVDVQDGRATLRVIDLAGANGSALQRFIEGRSDVILLESVANVFAPVTPTPPATATSTPAPVPKQTSALAQALADARKLFQALSEQKNPWGAVGLDAASAGAADVDARTRELAKRFTQDYPESTRPQRWRLEEAARTVSVLRAQLQSEIGKREQMQELVAEAEFLAGAGQREEARGALGEALALVPDDVNLRRRVEALDEALDLERAARSLDEERVAAEQAAAALDDESAPLPREEAIARARRAGRLSSSRTVLLRALRTLADAGDDDDVIAIAQHLIDIDPKDELPWWAMLQAHERAARWSDAARAGEALLRLRPKDAELRGRVACLVATARDDEG